MHTYTETIDAFRAAMAEAGMVVKEPLIADGILHRCHVDGDKPGTKNGAYILHMDGKPSGYFEHFKTGIRQTWSLSGKREPMTSAMRKQIEADRAKRQHEQQQAHRIAAEKARFAWGCGNPIADPSTHPYLERKQVQPHGLRMGRDGVLMIPLFNPQGEIVNLQFIGADGNKRFLSGGQKKGCFAAIGQHACGGKVVICEGWATGASLHEVFGDFVIVAMDAGNLEPVAQAIRVLDADAEIVIAGDNDLPDKQGLCKGQTEARKAALAVGGKYTIPPTPGNDWNDEINAAKSRKEACNG